MGFFTRFFKNKVKQDLTLLYEAVRKIIYAQVGMAFIPDEKIFKHILDNKFNIPPHIQEVLITHPYVLGYVFGMFDQILQKNQINEDDSLTIITIKFVEIFGIDGGARSIGIVLRNQNEPKIHAGIIEGGQDAHLWYTTQTPPQSLMFYLLENVIERVE